MCGIFGILQHRPVTAPERQRLKISARLLQHRGPDHHAVFSDYGIGLAYTRLALVDLNSRSNQPFWDRDNRYCLVYNGEIYNFRELRMELEAEGVVFRTTGDTEVLLESLIHRGLDATLPRLEGMFAFALYDVRERSLTLGRDRFGIKPLYVYEHDDVFVFASEICAMRPWISFEPDVLSISSYLQGFAGPTSGYSFYRNVRIVPPGTVVLVRPGGLSHYRPFWRMHDFWDPDETARLHALKPSQIVDEVEALLLESVRTQLLADAPVGVLCSGGVDSSLVTAMASRFHNNIGIFHANVVGPHSEYDAAAALAKHLKLDLKSIAVIDQHSIDLLPETIVHYGHPFTYHPNSVPFLMVSRLIRSYEVKGILSGEGADESYIGYPWLIFNLRAFLLRAPREAPRIVYRLLRQGLRRVFGRDIRHALDDPLTLVRDLHNRFETRVEEEDIREELRQKNGRDPTSRELLTPGQLSYHLRTLLHRNDCLGMAASIEARFPFLDTRLVRLAVNMPYNVKVRLSPTTFERAHYFLRDKWVLRKVAERYLPPPLAQRRKQGFPISAHNRMRIAPEFFESSFVADLFELGKREIRFLVYHANQQLKLKLLHLDVWGRVCLEARPSEDVKGRLQKYIAFQ